MSTIDHKQEAVHMLDHSNRYGTPIEAQVHATLYAAEQTAALVEQQRIANLIAYTESLATAERDGYVLPPREARGDVDVARDLIREGLGLA